MSLISSYLFSKEEKILDHKIYTNHFESFPSEIPFRSSCRTPKPRIYSNQTAIVTGPKGEEVFVTSMDALR